MLAVPFFRPSIGQAEINEAVDVLQSGWLTTGPRVKSFEATFAKAVGARYAVALNSATAALHLAVEALGLRAGQGVLVPAMTFAATAEIVRYLGAVPVLVDCDPDTLNISYDDAEQKIAAAHAGTLHRFGKLDVVGVIPVHVGGFMVDVTATRAFAERHGLWVVDDAAHAFPAAWRQGAASPWIQCGGQTSKVACFSFYANKTITTGEGGMAVTDDEALAERMRLMSLHGLSRDAWGRYQSGGHWDYRIVDSGFKYNMTDLAAAIGIHQLARAEEMRVSRESLANEYRYRLSDVEAIDVPVWDDNRLHAWHLFPIRLRLERLTIDRAAFITALNERKIGTSVHWRPLHLHPYYEQAGWTAADCPVASREWMRLISLPIFPSMSNDEQRAVIESVTAICNDSRRSA